jgi:hypothetical protein
MKEAEAFDDPVVKIDQFLLRWACRYQFSSLPPVSRSFARFTQGINGLPHRQQQLEMEGIA